MISEGHPVLWRSIFPEESPMHRPTVITDPACSLLKAKQIATFIGCSSKHVLRLAESGQFPKPVKVGKKMLRWPREAVERWLAEQP